MNNNNEGMTLARFSELVGAFGGSPRRWPDAERAAALTLFVGSPEAQALAARAAGLDDLLDDYAVEPPSQALRMAVLAGAPRASSPTARRLGVAAGLAAALILGLMTGALAPTAGSDPIQVADSSDAFQDF